MNETHPPPPVEHESLRREAPPGFDLHELIALLYRERWLGLSIFAGVFLLFILYALLATPIYRADALLKVEKSSPSLAGADRLLTGLFSSGASTEAEVEILRSRAILMPVVRHLGLDVTIRSPAGNHYDALRARIEHRSLVLEHFSAPPAFRGRKLRLVAGVDGHYRLLTPHRRPILDSRIGQSVETAGWHVQVSRLTARPGRVYRITEVRRARALRALRAGLSVIELGVRTGIIELALEGPHPRWLAQVVNATVRTYLGENVAAKAAQARESLAFIDRELPRLKQSLYQAESRFERYRAKTHVIDVSAQTRAFLREATSLEAMLTALRLRIADLSQSYEPGFPLVAALLREERELEIRKRVLRARIESLPLKQQQYLRLKRDVDIYTRLYMALLAKAQDLEVEKAGTVGNVRVVEDAVVPDLPVKPDRHLLAILGFFLGGGLALAAIFVKRALVHGIGDPEEIEDEFGLPFYALIPHSAREARSRRRKPPGMRPILALRAPDDPAVEALRSLRMSLDLSTSGTRTPVIAIGGPRKGVGKSFVALNLSVLLAGSGRQVLLVDADLHRGELEGQFGTPPAPGLSDLLQDGGDWRGHLRSHPKEGRLRILPRGTRVTHPERLFEGDRFGSLLEELRAAFDAVILDLPPFLGVTDGFLIARLATVNLFVLRAGIHSRPEIRFVLKKLSQTGVTPTGLVFNDLGFGIGAYRYYRYGYGYRGAKAAKGSDA